ncbi:hypothetical protein [Thermococcus sp.]|uniref:hypothetical protein n=1 Tax=Thermococcus sp. TaxID=35749 RepID=UPI002612B194|nr:hypothetical protein [Thermococcus sp.]
MRRFVVFPLLFSLLFLPLLHIPGVASVPTGGMNGLVMIDLNITVVNTAPFPKFLVLNPNYVMTVHRLGNNETTAGFNGNPRMVLNYNPGIWLMPYETVEINFRIIKEESYSLPGVPCSGGDGNYLACGVVIPQLINSPTQLSARSMFPVLDGHIRILKYEGTVSFVVSSTDTEFQKFFALTVPVLFTDGEMYGFTPNYTMTYENYTRKLYEYAGLSVPERTVPQPAFPSNMFGLTNTLLTGVSVAPPVFNIPESEKYDLPVWFVTTNSGIEITYRVKWRERGM